MTLVSTRLASLTSLVDLYRFLGGGWIERTGDMPRPADVGANRPSGAQGSPGQRSLAERAP
jgi:multidrug efflux system outer membrane protein